MDCDIFGDTEQSSSKIQTGKQTARATDVLRTLSYADKRHLGAEVEWHHRIIILELQWKKANIILPESQSPALHHSIYKNIRPWIHRLCSQVGKSSLPFCSICSLEMAVCKPYLKCALVGLIVYLLAQSILTGENRCWFLIHRSSPFCWCVGSCTKIKTCPQGC